MMCIDFMRDITSSRRPGRRNLVNITSPQILTELPSFNTQQLDILAVLDSEIVQAAAKTRALSDLQFAAWEVTAGASPASGPYGAGFTSGADADYNAALAASPALPLAPRELLVRLRLYSYFDPTFWPAGDGLPQAVHHLYRFRFARHSPGPGSRALQPDAAWHWRTRPRFGGSPPVRQSVVVQPCFLLEACSSVQYLLIDDAGSQIDFRLCCLSGGWALDRGDFSQFFAVVSGYAQPLLPLPLLSLLLR